MPRALRVGLVAVLSGLGLAASGCGAAAVGGAVMGDGSSSGGGPGDAGGDSAGAGSSSDLHVAGNTLVDHGKVVRLLGVDHSGTEYSCVGGGSDGSKGYAIFDGPSDDSLVTPMLAWKVNAVRIPLNEACWLGIGKVNPMYGGSNYTSAIQQFVAMIRSHGIYVILDLHWAAPGTSVGTTQQPMADLDNAPAFWKSVASAFKGDLGVVFDIFNEPYLGAGNVNGGVDPWQCLQNGCSAQLAMPLSGNYMTAGTRGLVDAVRSTGARNVVMVPGLAYTSDLSGWLTHKPNDPTGNVTASLHLYNFVGCADVNCWNMQYKALTASVPLVTDEIGENDCAHGFIDAYMAWADGLGVSYLGWSWNPYDCKSFPSLITDYATGNPTPFGQGLMTHLKSL